MQEAATLGKITRTTQIIEGVITSYAGHCQMYDYPNIEALLIVPRVMLSLILILPFTIIFCTLPLIVTLALFALLIFIISPLMLGYPISMIGNKTKRILCYLALVIFYPLIGSFFTLIFLIVVLLYPLLR